MISDDVDVDVGTIQYEYSVPSNGGHLLCQQHCINTKAVSIISHRLLARPRSLGAGRPMRKCMSAGRSPTLRAQRQCKGHGKAVKRSREGSEGVKERQ